MKPIKFLFILAVSVCLLQCTNQPSQNSGSSQEFVTPESQGISSQAILDFVNAAETERPDDVHSFILMRHGNIVARGWWNPYNPESTHMLYSLSKSFTSTAVGLAQSEGLLSVYDQVISFFPDETPAEPSDNLKAMRIKDLLRMNTGHNNDALGATVSDTSSWVRSFLALPVQHKPGTHFVYNSGATFMLSAIVQKVSGKTVFDYLTPRLFEPLGVENAWWETNMNGINTGGWGLNVRTKDIVNFGQLYLQKGEWEGKQLIPAEWIEEATTLQTCNGSNPDSDWDQGYGYQFWMCKQENVFRGDGAFGQYCIVMPVQDAVLAITSGTSDMQAILNLTWKHLLPAMKDTPIEENTETYKALEEKLASLQLSTINGEESKPLEVSGKTYRIDKNNAGVTSVSVNLNSEEKSITLEFGEDTYTIPVGFGELKKGECKIGGIGEQVLATSAGWISDTLRVKTYLYETPYNATFNLVFSGDKVTINGKPNVSFGRAGGLELVGYSE